MRTRKAAQVLQSPPSCGTWICPLTSVSVSCFSCEWTVYKKVSQTSVWGDGLVTCSFGKEKDLNSIPRIHIKKVDLFVFGTSLVYIVSSGLAGPLGRPCFVQSCPPSYTATTLDQSSFGPAHKDTVAVLVDGQLSFLGGGAGTVMGLSPEHPSLLQTVACNSALITCGFQRWKGVRRGSIYPAMGESSSLLR